MSRHNALNLSSVILSRTSRYNLEGSEIVRKDLPKVTRSFDIEVPNFGDWGNGSHTVTWDREVYIRDFLAPKELELEIELLAEEAGAESVFSFRFTVARVLTKTNVLIEDLYPIRNDLFFNLNLLQECVRSVDVWTR